MKTGMVLGSKENIIKKYEDIKTFKEVTIVSSTRKYLRNPKKK